MDEIKFTNGDGLYGKHQYTDMGFMLEPNMQDTESGVGNFMNNMTEIDVNL